MISAKLKRLRDTFDGWCRGDPYPTLEGWMQFGRELKEVSFEVAMLELGVDLAVVNVAVEAAKPDSNVVVLQPRRMRTAPVGDGGAS